MADKSSKTHGAREGHDGGREENELRGYASSPCYLHELEPSYRDDLAAEDGVLRNSIAVDDGDELNFCSTCAFSSACLDRGYDKSRLRDLHVLVEHIGPFREGQHIFREGDPFNAIAAIRAGTVKTYVTDLEGREQVQGFFLPGEVIGLSAISQSRFPCNAVALETVLLCRFSFPKMATLAAQMPGLQEQLFRLLSLDIGKAALLAPDFRAEERLAAFLLILSQRYAAVGLSERRIRLAMSRTDIANYIRLAPETVSRILKRFQQEALISVDRREVEILDMDRLRAIARSVLRK
ncbi:MAG TPA: helix-turn-helix domain-containing protein [Woeseiaceae bacterium]|nr:helix-turn-helix domain-containing protein [Woeseiaceae bacterium]